MANEAKALVDRVETLPDTHALPSTLALLFDMRDCIETQAREIERLITENAYLREALKEARAALGESHDQ